MQGRLTKGRFQLKRIVNRLGIDLSGLTPLQRARLTGTVKPAPAPKFTPQEAGELAAKITLPPKPNLLEAPEPEDLEQARQQIADLKAEVQRLLERARVNRDLVVVLREANAREKAAKAVIAAQLLEKQALDSATIHTNTLRALYQEQAQLCSAIQSEHNALRGLVAALFQTAFPARDVPDDLTKPGEKSPVKVSATHNPNNYLDPGDILPPPPPDPRSDWHKYLRGKQVGQTITLPSGEVLVTEGESITPAVIKRVQDEGYLYELMLHMTLGVQPQTPPEGLKLN